MPHIVRETTQATTQATTDSDASLIADLADLAERLGQAEQRLHDIHQHHRHHHHPCEWWQTPATVSISDHDLQGDTMTAYAPGQEVFLTATVRNAEGADVSDNGTWTSDNGTVNVPDPTKPSEAVLTGATLGTANVIYTTANSITGTDTITIADTTPATVTVTDSATAPTA